MNISGALLGKKLLMVKKYKIYPNAKVIVLDMISKKGELKTHKLNFMGKDYFYVKIVLF